MKNKDKELKKLIRMYEDLFIICATNHFKYPRLKDINKRKENNYERTTTKLG